MTFGFGFGSVRFDSVLVLVRFLFSGSGSVLVKTWVLVRFVLAGFGFFPIFRFKPKLTLQYNRFDFRLPVLGIGVG